MNKEKDMNIIGVVNKWMLTLSILGLYTITFANPKYDISVELLPQKRSIVGNIQMEYVNHSKDTLHELWIHLYPNAYSRYNTPWAKQMVKMGDLSFHYGKSLGYIDSLNFTHDDKFLTFVSSEDQPDVGVVLLENPLLPGDSIKINTPFKVKLPQLFSRSGYMGSYFSVTQWYPKFAVYENGDWKHFSYLEQGEFYSDFSDYHVEITLPSAYELAASGFFHQKSDTAVEKNTYTIDLKQVHDFAWYASKRFIVGKREMHLPNGRQIALQVYTIDSMKLNPILDYMETTIGYMSKYVGEYPYDVCTIVEGYTSGLGSGMEYPTISDVSGDENMLQEVVHEVVHNWWYGILANNERDEPFLDESITSYYEKRIIEDQFGNANETFKHFPDKISKYLGLYRMPDDLQSKSLILNQYRSNRWQALNKTSEDYTGLNFYAMIYAKGALDMKFLEQYLGRSDFDSIVKGFYQQYKFQHIHIQDLHLFFQENTSKDVEWFFDGVVSGNALADIAIQKVEKEGDVLKVQLKNKGDLKIPVSISWVKKDLTVIKTQMIDKFQNDTIVNLPVVEGADALYVDTQWLGMEANRKNNYYQFKGVHKVEPLQVRLFGAAEDPTRNQLFLLPLLAGNKYDGFMLGLSVYNRVFPVKKLEYQLSPLWGFKSKTFNWVGDVSYHFTPRKKKPFDIEIGLHSKSFTMNDHPVQMKYIKLQPFAIATFAKPGNELGPEHQLGYRNVQIWANDYSANLDTLTDEVAFSKLNYSYNTHELWYQLKYTHPIYPSELKTILRWDKNYIRQTFEYKQKFRYTQKGAYFHLRLFAGAFYYKNPDVSFRLNSIVGLNMSGVNGRYDYLMDGYYFGRNEQAQFASRQLMMGEGSFKVFTPMQNPPEGRTVNGLMAANFAFDSPIRWLPIRIFGDLGYTIDKVLQLDNLLPYKQFYYDFGFSISVLNEAVEIYFPLLMSDNFKSYYKSNLPKFGQRITFSIDLDKLNFYKSGRKGNIRNMFQ